MKIMPNLFPGGVKRALTMSYDDGQEYDARLTKIFDRYGIKGTFCLNSATVGREGFVSAEKIPEIYKNHEVAAHGVNHSYMNLISSIVLAQEIMEDKRKLERLSGQLIRGMSYPYGRYTKEVWQNAKMCGMEYSRTVNSTRDFYVPENFMEWHPTCHHDDDNLWKLWEKFLEPDFDRPMLFYVWGHSFEFERNHNWDRIEKFCGLAGGNTQIWYATNIQIKEYILAQHNLVYSADMNLIYNPSAVDVWVSRGEEAIEIPAGGYWEEK